MTLLATLVATSAEVAATRSRTAKIKALAITLQNLAPAEVDIGARYLAGETRQGKFGIGYALLREAVPAEAPALPTLTLAEVDARLEAIAGVRGTGSVARRREALQALMAQAMPPERDFLIRLLMGELRQGALEGIMVDAIAVASGHPAADVRRAAMYAGSRGTLAAAALGQDARESLRRFRLETLAPVAPMLAQTAEDTDAALAALGGEAIIEWKLDGARIQVHRKDDEVRIYTRSLNDVTAAVPEVVDLVRQLPIREVVLDGETIALQGDGRPHPFQVTMRRFGRKLDVEGLRAELPLSAYFFDVLRIDDEELTQRSIVDRLVALDRLLPPAHRVQRIVTRSAAEARAFYDDALARGHEGVMAKGLAAPYEAGNRGASWLKIKHAHTLDLVVLAAEWGSGRRTGFLSNLHLGARNPATGEYVMLGKTFKGLTDELLKWQTAEFLARETHRTQWAVHVRPEIVVEIAFNDLQASSQYPGGMALRFARVKGYRPDKTAADADTLDTVRAIFQAQGAAAEAVQTAQRVL